MQVTHVLAVTPVSDVDAATQWYARFFDAQPTNIPMPGILAEWRIRDDGWLQVTLDEKRSGSGLFNLAVADLAAATTELARRGIAAGDVVHANKGVETVEIRDPFGNSINLIGGFREEY